jgi:hypothetical protein
MSSWVGLSDLSTAARAKAALKIAASLAPALCRLGIQGAGYDKVISN